MNGHRFGHRWQAVWSQWDFEIDLSNCSRPYLIRWIIDDHHGGLSLQWGNTNSVPPLRLPGWLLDRWER